MQIDCIEIFHVRLPLVEPFNTAYGDADVIESVIVALSSKDLPGLIGWGEATSWAWPGYCSEYAQSTFDVIDRFLSPLLLGKSFETSEMLLAVIAHIKGNYFAKGALDCAWWDLHAKAQGKPLWQAIGGKAGPVKAGADFGVMPTVEQLLDKIAAATEQGFERIKLKFRPGWDLPMISRVREAFPEMTFHIDCNSAYRLEDADQFKALDEFNLAMIEQPLAHDDLIDHAKLQGMLRTPICLDESITSVDRARKAIEIGACRWFNIKPPRVGGLTNAIAIHDLAEAAGISCWVGSMLESNIGSNCCLALATLGNMKYPGDLFPSDRFYATDLADPPMRLSGPSTMTPSDAPGIGVEPNVRRITDACIRSKRITL